jgi:hypothetical protein
MTGALDAPLSQSSAASQPFVLGDNPSHCSTNASDPGVKPVATTVNDSGFPPASPGTEKGLLAGWVMEVAACAMPVRPNTQVALITINALTRRKFPRMLKRFLWLASNNGSMTSRGSIHARDEESGQVDR